jgi:hypothetical protein
MNIDEVLLGPERRKLGKADILLIQDSGSINRRRTPTHPNHFSRIR